MCILHILAPVELTMYLRLPWKYYVVAVSSKRSSTTFEMQKIQGTRMGHTIYCLIIPVWLKCLQKRQTFSVSPIYSEIKDLSNNGEYVLNRTALFMNKREKNGNIVSMYGAIYRFFFTILLMYIHRKATKVQVKIVLKTSLEYILSKIILILIYLPRYFFFLILVCLLMPVRKSLSVKFRLI